MREKPIVMTFVIPGTDEAEIRGQFSRFKREFSPSRIEIYLDSEKGVGSPQWSFPRQRKAGATSRLTRGRARHGARRFVKRTKEPPERDSTIGLHGTVSQEGRN